LTLVRPNQDPDALTALPLHRGPSPPRLGRLPRECSSASLKPPEIRPAPSNPDPAHEAVLRAANSTRSVTEQHQHGVTSYQLAHIAERCPPEAEHVLRRLHPFQSCRQSQLERILLFLPSHLYIIAGLHRTPSLSCLSCQAAFVFAFA
jgi:hypothetical protein